ncbi:trypsin-like serine protease [Streptomyces vinaceus]|uniref:trypsin-like serine protease n=1 Tax=Streptomyces vinaceus TaxID=1960 RepID=UPI0036B77BCE
MLEATGADLVAGDGNITYTSCSGPYQIKVWARDLKTNDSNICFQAANTGYLAVSIPRAYRVETKGRDLNAQITVNGETSRLAVPKDTSKGFGEASPTNPQQATLLEMRVTGSSAAAPAPEPGNSPLAFAGKLAIGDTRSCTAVLVDPRWVLTAKSCFADNPAENNSVAAGAPKQKTVLTVGRADLATSGGHSTGITNLIPHPDRDLVLAQLAVPAFGITPAPLSSTAPAAGQELTVAGYGRNASAWAPSKVQSATYTVGATETAGFDITAKAPAGASLCKGSAGSPALRLENGAYALAAVVGRAWQNNCIDTPATDKAGAYTTRVDGLGAWVKSSTGLVIKPGQVIAPGTTLTTKHLKLSMQADGNLVMYHNSGGEGKGGALWSSNTYGNPGAYAIMQADGNFVVYTKTGGDGKGGHLWSTATMGNAGAYLTFQNDGNLVIYKQDGGEGAGGSLWSTDTWMHRNIMPSDDRFGAGFWVDSPNKILVMQRDGRMYIWSKTQAKELWSSNVAAGGDGSFLHMGPDGNLVAYRKGGGPTSGNSFWSTATYGNPGAYLHFQNDGNLVLYKKDGGEGKGGALWSSNTYQ